MIQPDTLFFSSKLAQETALKQNETETIPAHPIKALQICYYIGDKVQKDVPKNCIHIVLENFYNYFVTTKNRFPKIIDIRSDEYTKEEAKVLGEKILEILEIAKEERDNLVNIYAKNIINQVPDFNEKKIKVFIPTIREATVIKYVSENIAEVFEKIGCEVLFYLPDELGEQYPLAKYHYMYELNPHIVITVDFIENRIINKNTFYFCWMQDPMPILYNQEPIIKRDNDYFFSLQNRYSEQLIKKGIDSSKVFFQPFATNTNIFFENINIKKEKKIVFLGSDYNFEKNYNISKECINEIIYNIDNNSLGKELELKLANKYGFDINTFDTYIVVSITRRRVIEWLCSLRDIKIEVYGTDLWLKNEIVAPFYKGLLNYGEEMANIYNSAEYALAVHPHYRYQQRTIEISSCGSIPIVYEGKLSQKEEDFKHKKNILSFSTLKELQKCIGQKTEKDSRQIAKDISYENMVGKILDIVKRKVKNG